MRHLRKIKSISYTAALLMLSATLLPLFTNAALAQSSKGIVVGTVNDSQGAVVGGAAVKIINKSTNVSRDTTTSSEGNFRIDAVDPGHY